MKLLKNTFLSMGLLASLATSVQAQTLFSEDFSGATGNGIPSALPAGWSIFDIDGFTPNGNVAAYTDAWMQVQDLNVGSTTGGCAVSNSWYDPVDQSDDWMFTPAIVIPATGNFTLSWKGASQDVDPTLAESYEVYIMTAAPTSGNLNTATLLTSIVDEPASFTPHSVSLSAYLGQTVYIGFRNISDDNFILKIDDVLVASPSTDVAIDNLAPVVATMYPMSQIPAAGTTFSVEATNLGTTAVMTPTVMFSLLASNGNMLSSVAGTGQGLPNTGSVNQVSSTSPLTWPTMLGNYTIQALNTTAGDGNATNDTTMAMFAITDSVYALEMGANTGTLGIGTGDGGYLGQSFFINNADTATSISIYVDSGFTGTRYAAVIYNTDAAGNNPPTTLLAATDTMMHDGTAGWKHLRLPANTVLNANTKYAVLAIQFDSILRLGRNDNYFYPQNVWVQWPGNPNGATTWSNAEDFGFETAYLLRLNFASSLVVGVQENTFNNSLQVFPNPNNGSFTVQMDLGASADAEISVRNIEGKLVHTEQLGAQAQLQKTLNLQQLPAGVYFVQVRNAGHTYQQRIIKQ